VTTRVLSPSPTGIFYVMLENSDTNSSGEGWAMRQAILIHMLDFVQVRLWQKKKYAGRGHNSTISEALPDERDCEQVREIEIDS
jgi:hypothetical protein